jgi:HlyD family secretion protein
MENTVDIPREAPSRKRRYLPIAVGAVLVLGVTAGLWSMEPAAPSVDRSTIWTDSVRRGEFVRQVRGPGTLVPEQARWIVAVTSGRIERIHVQPGAQVGSETILLELSNPDVQVEGLNAERQLAAAEAELSTLRVTLATQRLEQRSRVAQVEGERRDTERRLEASRELAGRNLIPQMDLQRLEDEAAEAATRLGLERERLDLLERSLDQRIGAQRRQIERLGAISEFQGERLESMLVRATAPGIVQDLTLEIGQWVMPGQPLARVVEPGRLMAVLRVPETQARDVTVGQPVAVDTRNGIVPGVVRRIDPSVQQGAVAVEIALTGELPLGARPDLSVEGTVQVDRIEETLFVGRPAYGQANSMVSVWKVVDGGRHAVRVPVRLGLSSVNTIEVIDGLSPGDVVILSDLSAYDAHERIRLR